MARTRQRCVGFITPAAIHSRAHAQAASLCCVPSAAFGRPKPPRSVRQSCMGALTERWPMQRPAAPYLRIHARTHAHTHSHTHTLTLTHTHTHVAAFGRRMQTGRHTILPPTRGAAGCKRLRFGLGYLVCVSSDSSFRTTCSILSPYMCSSRFVRSALLECVREALCEPLRCQHRGGHHTGTPAHTHTHDTHHDRVYGRVCGCLDVWRGGCGCVGVCGCVWVCGCVDVCTNAHFPCVHAGVCTCGRVCAGARVCVRERACARESVCVGERVCAGARVCGSACMYGSACVCAGRLRGSACVRSGRSGVCYPS